MDDFRELYRQIEYLRNNGIKMKEIADCAGMASQHPVFSVHNSAPDLFRGTEKLLARGALDHAIVLVNNISKRRLLSVLPELLERLGKMEPNMQSDRKANPFLEHLQEEILLSTTRVDNICGLYTSYSLSSSSDCLKMEPFIISLSENKEYIRIGRLNAYGEAQWGHGGHQLGSTRTIEFYCMFSEKPPRLNSAGNNLSANPILPESPATARFIYRT